MTCACGRRRAILLIVALAGNEPCNPYATRPCRSGRVRSEPSRELSSTKPLQVRTLRGQAWRSTKPPILDRTQEVAAAPSLPSALSAVRARGKGLSVGQETERTSDFPQRQRRSTLPRGAKPVEVEAGEPLPDDRLPRIQERISRTEWTAVLVHDAPGCNRDLRRGDWVRHLLRHVDDAIDVCVEELRQDNERPLVRVGTSGARLVG